MGFQARELQKKAFNESEAARRAAEDAKFTFFTKPGIVDYINQSLP